MDVGTDLVVARDDQGREVLLVDGRVAVRSGRDAGRGDAGYLGAALQGAGEVGHVAAWGVDGLWAG